MRTTLIGGCICLGICGLLLLSGCGSDSETEASGAQTTCPMTGKAIDKKVFADSDGKRVFFCGTGCAEAFKKDPAATLKKLADDGVAVREVPKLPEFSK